MLTFTAHYSWPRALSLSVCCSSFLFLALTWPKPCWGGHSRLLFALIAQPLTWLSSRLDRLIRCVALSSSSSVLFKFRDCAALLSQCFLVYRQIHLTIPVMEHIHWKERGSYDWAALMVISRLLWQKNVSVARIRTDSKKILVMLLLNWSNSIIYEEWEQEKHCD